MLASLAARTEQRAHPLLAERPIEKVLLVLITADRGLCGAFNANLIRAAQDYLERRGDKEVSIIAVGRKGRDAFRKQPLKMISEHINLFGRLEFSQAQQIAKEIIDLYTQQKVDAVDFIYNEFKSIMTQRVMVERYLPVKPVQPATGEALIDYIYEQPAPEIFNALLPRYVEIEVYRALLESQAAELAAQYQYAPQEIRVTVAPWEPAGTQPGELCRYQPAAMPASPCGPAWPGNFPDSAGLLEPLHVYAYCFTAECHVSSPGVICRCC